MVSKLLPLQFQQLNLNDDKSDFKSQFIYRDLNSFPTVKVQLKTTGVLQTLPPPGLAAHRYRSSKVRISHPFPTQHR